MPNFLILKFPLKNKIKTNSPPALLNYSGYILSRLWAFLNVQKYIPLGEDALISNPPGYKSLLLLCFVVLFIPPDLMLRMREK